MISLRLRKVRDEKALSSLLRSLERRHGDEALYQETCLERTFNVVIEGPNEERFGADLAALASKAGWSVAR